MKLMTITIKAAFLDAPNETADGIADSLIPASIGWALR